MATTKAIYDYQGIEINIEYKPIKRMHLRVKPPLGAVSLSCPKSTSLEKIEEFLKQHNFWLKKTILKVQSRPQIQGREYVTGETIYIWGKEYKLEVCSTDQKERVGVLEDKLVLMVKKGTSKTKRELLVEKWLVKQLEMHLQEVFDESQAVVSKEANSWYTRKMSTRWGTCNITTGRICINQRLVHLEPKFLFYIVIHELTHLWESGHGEKFKARMDLYCPKWRILRKELNEQAGLAW